MEELKPNKKIEGIDLQDENIKYVLLDSGTYKIDGEIISVDSYYGKKPIGVKDFTDIRIVDTTTYIEQYVNGTEFKSVEDYESEKEILLSKRKVQYVDDDGDTCYSWETLEDEFAYRKFDQLWKPIRKTIQTISEPIEVAVEQVKTESGNKFITSCFLNGIDKESTLFKYDKPSALQSIVSECFTELGMVFDGDCNYGKTEGKKIWGNSSHSCIRYVTAFGTYIFGEGWDIRHQPKGKLSELLTQYENDKKTIRNIIISKYNKHFGRIEQGNFDFDGLLNKLNYIKNTMQKVDPKQKTYDDYRLGMNKIKEAIDMIQSAYSVTP